MARFEKEISQRDTFGSGKDTIILSKAEHKVLFAQLKQYSDYIWPDHLFPNSQRMSSDSAFKAFPILYAKNDPERKKKDYQYFYSFSKPFYIRGNTVALVSAAKMCGSECGSNELAFYELRNGHWQFKAHVSGGEF